MKPRVKRIVDRLLDLREEFDDDEILEAMRHVCAEHLNESDARHNQDSSAPQKHKRRRGSSAPPKASRVVLALRKTDPERFDILTILDSLLRAGEVLPSLERIRSVGSALNKDFAAGKSRKDAIPKLMTLLVGLPVEQLQEIVKSILGESSNARYGSEEEAYSKLANFLIRGER